ncbi:MAG: hypothetical protein LAT67_09710, partial [Balneolales bacterium]|nr:hypothetical protein [Balneolales bacterium]
FDPRKKAGKRVVLQSLLFNDPIVSSAMNASKISVTKDFIIQAFDNMPYLIFYNRNNHEIDKVLELPDFQIPRFTYSAADQSFRFNNEIGDNRIVQLTSNEDYVFVSLLIYDDMPKFRNYMVSIHEEYVSKINDPHLLIGAFQSSGNLVSYNVMQNELVTFEI